MKNLITTMKIYKKKLNLDNNSVLLYIGITYLLSEKEAGGKEYEKYHCEKIREEFNL